MDADSMAWVVIVADGRPMGFGETEEAAIERAGVDVGHDRVNVYTLTLVDVQERVEQWTSLERQLKEAGYTAP